MTLETIQSQEPAPREFLGKTKNGLDVSVDMKSAHAATHFAHNPKLFDLVKRTIPTIEATDDHIRVERDTGKEAGTSDLVDTDEHDVIVYAKRPLRAQYSRFVKNRTPAPTSWITIDLRKKSDTEYDLYTAYVGRLVPSFPGGSFLPDQSVDFWSTHALVWGPQEIIPGTETSECPW